jgi:DNA-binding NtrC family response regulator
MVNQGKVLIVDDNEEILLALRLFLSDYFKDLITIKNPVQIPQLMEHQDYDVILLDMNFQAGINTGNEGIYWMHKILEYDPAAIIVLMTAYGDVELAVRAIKEGATDFIQKPWEDEKLLTTILNAYKIRRSNVEIQQLKNRQKHLSERIDQRYNMVIGKSDAMQKVYETVAKVAETDANVIILGENGTGKELIAREIHRQSNRTGGVFVNVDLGALTETLFESEMFGCVKGAYTDAKEDRPGRFEIASRGTLFLDEIGNLSLSLQAKLLTVLQNREVTRLGSNQPIPFDIRLISATNKPIYNMVQKETFREDLLFRINTIQIELPPLRERIEDLPYLVDFFLRKYEKKYKKDDLRVTEKAIQKLKKHHWSGNVRELQHAIEKAVILTDSRVIDAEDFFFQSGHHLHLPDRRSLNLEENEKELIKTALQKHNGNLTSAVKELGVTRKTLYNKIKKYGLGNQ